MHPFFGLWSAKTLVEAKDMLAACNEWLVASGLKSLQTDFIIIDVESGMEVE